MRLTLNDYRRLAETIHQRMQQLHAEGIRGLAVLDRMVTYLPDMQRIWEGASDAQLQQLCDEFPGFYQYAQIMEEVLRDCSRRDREILTRFYLLEQSQEQICKEMDLNDTQFRLLKSRAKQRFSDEGRRRMAKNNLRTFSVRKRSGT